MVACPCVQLHRFVYLYRTSHGAFVALTWTVTQLHDLKNHRMWNQPPDFALPLSVCVCAMSINALWQGWSEADKPGMFPPISRGSRSFEDSHRNSIWHTSPQQLCIRNHQKSTKYQQIFKSLEVMCTGGVSTARTQNDSWEIKTKTPLVLASQHRAGQNVAVQQRHRHPERLNCRSDCIKFRWKLLFFRHWGNFDVQHCLAMAIPMVWNWLCCPGYNSVSVIISKKCWEGHNFSFDRWCYMSDSCSLEDKVWCESRVNCKKVCQKVDPNSKCKGMQTTSNWCWKSVHSSQLNASTINFLCGCPRCWKVAWRILEIRLAVIKTCGNLQGKLLQPNRGRSSPTTECLVSGFAHKLLKSHQPLLLNQLRAVALRQRLHQSSQWHLGLLDKDDGSNCVPLFFNDSLENEKRQTSRPFFWVRVDLYLHIGIWNDSYQQSTSYGLEAETWLQYMDSSQQHVQRTSTELSFNSIRSKNNHTAIQHTTFRSSAPLRIPEKLPNCWCNPKT